MVVLVFFFNPFCHLCFLFEVFNPFTFNETSDKVGLCLPFCYLFSVCLIPPLIPSLLPSLLLVISSVIF